MELKDGRKQLQEEVVVKMLKERKITLALAESCTGGAVSSSIVNVPGASEVFEHGFVTYSNRAKKKILGVKEETLATYTAVSRQCAAEMAEGAASFAEAGISLSVTGLAGPDGGTEEIPVGTVFMGCWYRGCCVVREFHFQGDRSMVRAQAVCAALSFLVERMSEM